MAKKSTSPWVYVGCGCLGAVVLGIGACIGLGVVGTRFARNLEAELKDPALRQERAREILGADELPEGFHAQLHVSVPWIFEMVVLSDGEPVEYRDDGDADLEARHLGDNAFVYLAMPDLGDAREDFERLLEGRDSRDLENVQFDLDFRSEELLGRGEIDLPPQHVRYATHRGEFRDGRERSPGVYSVLLVDCPGSSKVRAGFYWQRRPEQAPALEAGPGADLGGTPYEDALRAFLGHFQLCGG
ncbi:MAG TPA: hypothetical protein VGG06_11800 [Thermoanaerobaculia bacterium]|jgi:hypothetical protein